jgi:hypothetical protein
LGHPCQKHPSTNTATRSTVKKKSGHPGRAETCICQPRVPKLISSALSFSSVLLLPRGLMALMFALRVAGVELDRDSEDMRFSGFQRQC